MVKNKSTVFILPMILNLPFRTFTGFKNVFIGLSTNSDLDDLLREQRRIYVVFKGEDVFSKYYEKKEGNTVKVIDNVSRVSKLKSHPQFVSTHEFGNYVAFEFFPDSKYVEDFDLFKKGHYSKFSDTYKKVIKNMYPKGIDNIIYPTEQDRKNKAKELGTVLPEGAEILSIPNLLEESLSPAQFIEIIK